VSKRYVEGLFLHLNLPVLVSALATASFLFVYLGWHPHILL